MSKAAHGRKHRTGKTANTGRNWIAVAAWDRNSAGPMGGDTRKARGKDGRTRARVKADIRAGKWS